MTMNGTDVTDYVFIEPADARRRDFARWCLAQDPQIQTSGSTGSNVPLDLYPTVPEELLRGAFVDGFPYGGTAAALDTTAATEQPETPETPKTEEAEQPRKRTARKPRKRTTGTAAKAAEAVAEAVVVASVTGSDGGSDG